MGQRQILLNLVFSMQDFGDLPVQAHAALADCPTPKNGALVLLASSAVLDLATQRTDLPQLTLLLSMTS